MSRLAAVLLTLLLLPACPDRPASEAASAPASSDSGPTRQELLEAATRLTEWVGAGASDPTNPWALAHGVVGFGPEHRTSDGRLAIDVMVQQARREPAPAGDEIVFPASTPSGSPVEPHRHLMAKVLMGAEVPLDRAFEISDGSSATLRDIMSTVTRQASVPNDEAGWHDFAWTLSALLQLPPHEQSPKLPELTREGLTYLEQQQAFLSRLMEEDRPEAVEKRQQLIYSHTCGGLHLAQAVLEGASRLPAAGIRMRAERQLQILLFRYRSERALYRQMREQSPEYELLIRIQELKFFGHLLETLALAHAWGLRPDDEETRSEARAVARDLLSTLDALEPSYGDLTRIRSQREQSYLDLIGDGCHAIHGLQLTAEIWQS